MSCTSNRILSRPLSEWPHRCEGLAEHLYVLCVCVCVRTLALFRRSHPSPPTPPGSVPTRGCELTGHVHHAAVAQSQHLVGLTEQAAGADAVRVVAGELLLAGGAAVPPGLGQVGQLNTGVC